jgi:hypothetical protein
MIQGSQTFDVFREIADDAKAFSPARDRDKAERIKSLLFKPQSEFLEDTSRRKTLLCPRRAGKSFSAAVYLMVTALTRPTNANCLYATLTKGSARGILWPLLKQFDEDYELNCHFHNTQLICTFPGGRRRIILTGAESRAEIDKLRGQAYDLVIIDECKSFPTDVLTELVREVIGPALNDNLGSMVLMGTPGNVLAGVFYETTKPASRLMRPFKSRKTMKAKRWSGHNWNIKENIAQPHLWDACLADKESYGWGDDNPIWKREYLGTWVSDDDAFVYKYDEDKHAWEKDPDSKNEFGLPDEHQWKYLMGCDLGYDDPFSLVVVAYAETSNELYHVYDYKEASLTVSDIARVIKETQKIFGEFEVMVGDRGGLGKMVLAELSERHELHIEAAEKTEKRDFIELLNSDMIEGRIKILDDSELAMEMKYLVWDEHGQKEDRACANHTCDAFLYTWRYSFHNFSRELKRPAIAGTKQYWEDKFKAEREAIYARKRSKDKGDYFQSLEESALGDSGYGDEESWIVPF